MVRGVTESRTRLKRLTHTHIPDPGLSGRAEPRACWGSTNAGRSDQVSKKAGANNPVSESPANTQLTCSGWALPSLAHAAILQKGG